MTKKRFISFITVLSLILSFIVLPANAVSPYSVVLPDPDSGGSGTYSGMYYLKNYAYDKYLQIDEDVASSTSLAQMEQWSFDGGSDQKWHFVHLGNEYYKILSIASGLALSVPSGSAYTADVTLIQEAYTGETRQQWSIDETSRGTVIIRPRSGETDPNAKDWCMASQSNSSNEAKVQQRAYTPNTPYNDEWVLAKYSAFVNNYYDLGYNVRYGESEAVAKSKIDSYTEAVAERYYELFGLEIQINNAQYYNSAIDRCKGTVSNSNIDTLCTFCNVTHTNRSVLISNFSSRYAGNDLTTNVLWTGHKIISTATNGTINENRSCSSGTSVFMLGIFSNSERDIVSKGALLHELNHQYGAPDHYHEPIDTTDDALCKFKDICSECGDNPRASTCIMYSRTDITLPTVICEDCKEDIIEHLGLHH